MHKAFSIAWQEKAACLGATDLFYSTRSRDQDAAKSLCRICMVRKSCLAYALLIREDQGIWGGYTAEERRSILSLSIVVPDFHAKQEALLTASPASLIPPTLKPLNTGMEFMIPSYRDNTHIGSLVGLQFVLPEFPGNSLSRHEP